MPKQSGVGYPIVPAARPAKSGRSTTHTVRLVPLMLDKPDTTKLARVFISIATNNMRGNSGLEAA